MSISKKIRTQAKSILQGNWTPAVCGLFVVLSFIFLIFALIVLLSYTFVILKTDEILASCVTIFTAVVALLFASPVFNGFFRFHYNLSLTKDADLSNIFDFFRNGKYFKTILFNINVFFRSLQPLYLLIILINIVALSLSKNIVHQALYILVIVIWCLCVLLDLFKSTITHFLYVDNPDLKINYYFKIAKAINKQHYQDTCKLCTSFLLWIALCFFTLPIFYVIPYCTTSLATSAKWLIKLYKDGKIV